MKPDKELNAGIDEPEVEPSELFVGIGILIIEGRTPLACGRGYGEGPHCSSIISPASAAKGHVCRPKDLQCVLQENFRKHMLLLWQNNIPMSIEVLLCPDCCSDKRMQVSEATSGIEPNCVLLEQWTICMSSSRSPDAQITTRALIQAVRSYLHFSQLSAWYSLTDGKLPSNVVYRVCVPGEVFSNKFNQDPEVHSFPLANVGWNNALKVSVRALPRNSQIPQVSCRVHNTAPLNHEWLTTKEHLAASADCCSHSSSSSLFTSQTLDLRAQPLSQKPDIFLGDGLLDPPQLLEMYPKRFQSPSRSGSPSMETPEHLMFGHGHCSRGRPGGPQRERGRSWRKNEFLQDSIDHCMGSSSRSGSSHSRGSSSGIKFGQDLIPEKNLPNLGSQQGPSSSPSSSSSSTLPAICQKLLQKRPSLESSHCEEMPFMNPEVLRMMMDPSKLSTEETIELLQTMRPRTGSFGSQRQRHGIDAGSSSPLGFNKKSIPPDKGMEFDDSGIELENLSLSRSMKEAPVNYAFQKCDGNVSESPESLNFNHKVASPDKQQKCKMTQNPRPFFSDEYTLKGNAELNKLVYNFENRTNTNNNFLSKTSDNGYSNSREMMDVQVQKPNEKFVSESTLSSYNRFLNHNLFVNKSYHQCGGTTGETYQSDKCGGANDDGALLDVDEENNLCSSQYSEADVIRNPATQVTTNFLDSNISKLFNKDSNLHMSLFKKFCSQQNQTLIDELKKEVPSADDKAKFRRSLDSATTLVFHKKTRLPLTSSPAPLRKGTRFDFDSSLTSVAALKHALFDQDHPMEEEEIKKQLSTSAPTSIQSNSLLGNFEESVLNGRLEPVSTVQGFVAEIGASGSFCPKHLTLPVTVFFYTLSDVDKVATPYMGHINLGKKGYHIPRKGTIQVTLFNPHGTVVKMFVVVYDLTDMPARCQTFLRQRTLYMPVGASAEELEAQKWLRYLIHLRFASSKSGRIFLHTDIRMVIFRKSDMDAATLHSKGAYELRSFTKGPVNPTFSPKR